MIQDIFPKHLNNQYIDKKPEKDSKILWFGEKTVFLKMNENRTIQFLSYAQLEEACEKIGSDIPKCRYLFSIGREEDALEGDEEKEDFFLSDLSDINIEGFSFHKMFDVRSMKPMEAVLAASTAWHLYVWYRDNQFCGRCGQKLHHDKKERMMRCACCNNMVFPKIAPAVIVGVTNGDNILMTKYADREYKRYALIAGFTEIGETAEETVKREVMEEVGLRVKNIKYYKSQPWGFDSNLLLGFYCELDDTSEITLDEEELSVAEWINYRDIQDDYEGLSLTREMMTHFREQKKVQNEIE